MGEAIVSVLYYFALPTVIVAAVFLLLLFFVLPREVRIIFKREVTSYFTSPIAYVCVVIYLLISNGISFWFGGVLERGEADLYLSYFQYIPWYMIVIAPAVGMRLWSEEQRLGTMELLLTMPVAPWHAIVGKYLAAAVVLFAMMVLSVPIVFTMNYLGDPDNGVMLAGFVACFAVGLSFLAVTSVVSAFTRSQIVSLLVSLALCLSLWLMGLQPVVNTLHSFFWWAPGISEFVSRLSVLTHFNQLARGVLFTDDVIYFITFVVFALFATSAVLRYKRS